MIALPFSLTLSPSVPHSTHFLILISFSLAHFSLALSSLQRSDSDPSMSRSLSATDGDGSSASAGEIMLFGVRVVVDSMRKCVSMNDLSQYEHPLDGSNNNKDVLAGGYVSADDAVAHNSGKHRERERKRGVPWTEEEHKLFLLGLQKVGKGDWRGISKNYVKTRTPTQVASHAQKYFLRKSNLNRRRRRSSLFDIDSVSAIPMEEQIQHRDNMPHAHLVHPASSETNDINGFSMMPLYPMAVGTGFISFPCGSPMEKLTLGHGNCEHNGPTKVGCPVPFVPDPKASSGSEIASSSSSSVDLPTLSLGLSLSSDQRKTSSRNSSLHAVPCFNNGESIGDSDIYDVSMLKSVDHLNKGILDSESEGDGY